MYYKVKVNSRNLLCISSSPHAFVQRGTAHAKSHMTATRQLTSCQPCGWANMAQKSNYYPVSINSFTSAQYSSCETVHLHMLRDESGVSRQCVAAVRRRPGWHHSRENSLDTTNDTAENRNREPLKRHPITSNSHMDCRCKV